MLTDTQERHFVRAINNLSNYLIDIPFDQEVPRCLYEQSWAYTQVLARREQELYPSVNVEFIGDINLDYNTIEVLGLLGYLSDDDVSRIKQKFFDYYEDSKGDLYPPVEYGPGQFAGNYDNLDFRDTDAYADACFQFVHIKKSDMGDIALQKAVDELKSNA